MLIYIANIYNRGINIMEVEGVELDKGLASGSMEVLVLKLLEDGDRYSYEMTEMLRQRSQWGRLLTLAVLIPFGL